MAGWRGCGSGGDRYDTGRVSELAPRRRGAVRAGPVLRGAAVDGRDARRAPVRERRRAAGDSGAAVGGTRARGLARSAPPPPPTRAPGGAWVGRGAGVGRGGGGGGATGGASSARVGATPTGAWQICSRKT